MFSVLILIMVCLVYGMSCFIVQPLVFKNIFIYFQLITTINIIFLNGFSFTIIGITSAKFKFMISIFYNNSFKEGLVYGEFGAYTVLFSVAYFLVNVLYTFNITHFYS